MRLALVCGVALALAPAAVGAPPLVSASADATKGSAPLTVTLTASGDAASYRWELGDGSTAEGPVVAHTYAEPGDYTAVVTATSATGEAAQATMALTAFRLTLSGPRKVHFGRRAVFRGSLRPARAGVEVVLARDGQTVAATRTVANGAFRVRARIVAPGPYEARFGEIRSSGRELRVRPALEARLVGSRIVGEPLRLIARLRPAAAGSLSVRVWRNGRTAHNQGYRHAVRLGLGTRRPSSLRVRVVMTPAPGYTGAVRTLRASVIHPQLALGSRGPSVRALEQRLSELHYALPGVDGWYGLDTYQAVLAFQKVRGLPWTGRLDARTWRSLVRADVPRARYRGTHLEVSKGRQVLLVVRAGRVVRVIHVSTGATGNTPLGRWRIYRKVAGWDWVLWYPMYFLRGFAIHGYPSVPAYPASHGCVRVPMWIAPSLYAKYEHGQTVYVYW